MPHTNLSAKDKQAILAIARHAIQFGLQYQQPPVVELEKYSSNLSLPTGAFVTLTESNQLRGCQGEVITEKPILQLIADAAFDAAFNDSRFPRVNHLEEPVLHISISILSELSSIQAETESSLIEQIKQGIDGVYLEYDQHISEFLPDVWERFYDKSDFINQLKLKAKLKSDFWSPKLKFYKFKTIIID